MCEPRTRRGVRALHTWEGVLWALTRPRRLRKLILWGRWGGATLGGGATVRDADGERI